MKKIIIVLCIIFICNFNQILANNSKDIKKQDEQLNNKIIAYYFHGNFRCISCKKIEEWSHEAINKNFKNQIQQKQIIWKTVNTDLPENNHFVTDYNLYTKSLVLVKIYNGKKTKWKNLEKVWHYLGNQNKFYEYVINETTNFIKEN